MGGSIAHPDPAARRAALESFLTALGGELREARGEGAGTGEAASLREFGRLLGSIDPSAAPHTNAAATERLRVCRFWEASLGSAGGVPKSLGTALHTLRPAVSGAQNPNYRRRPPDATFLDNYGYAVIAGPLEGPPALVPDARVALGVLLLGPPH